MAPRETKNNAYTKFWGDKQSIMVCYGIFWSGQKVAFLYILNALLVTAVHVKMKLGDNTLE